jgi:hypothetical protein
MTYEDDFTLPLKLARNDPNPSIVEDAVVPYTISVNSRFILSLITSSPFKSGYTQRVALQT